VNKPILGPKIWQEVTKNQLINLCHSCEHFKQLRLPKIWQIYIYELFGISVDRNCPILFGTKIIFSDISVPVIENENLVNGGSIGYNTNTNTNTRFTINYTSTSSTSGTFRFVP